jgi:hypothetical protein
MQRAPLILLFLFVGILFAGTLAAEDSPLVAAAKSRKNSKVKAKIKITNETLSKEGGHISTTAVQPPIVLPPQEQVKAAPKVTMIGTAPEAAKKGAQRVPDAMRYSEGGRLTEEDIDFMAEDVPPVMLSPRMTEMLVEPQSTAQTSEPQQSQKPKPPQ